MLGKLMAYELRALWKPAAVMLAVMVVAGAAGIGCLGATQMLGEVARSGIGAVAAPMSGNATVALFMAALFCGFLVWAAAAALYVFVAMRFYRTMFTDEGYLTLTLPVRAGTLIMAKFWVAYLLLVAFSLVALLMYALMVLAISGDTAAVAGVLSIMGGWGAFVADGDVASVLGGIVNTLVTCAYALGLAFCSLTLGAWWARRHKVAAAVGVYLAAGWAIALVFSIAGVVVMAGSVAYWDVALTAVSLAQTLANIGVAVGGLALAAHLVRTKVDLG
ncbi:hypothetical protein [Adlercreutzia caecimuris]|uniref:hypothetical protein n=1 Tax=Adlercreutzia caecimuris TaxID=671266 RepID=UPI00272B28DB|nr:hypothetical protein [Adlercreutzia caecimuris]